MEVGDASPNVLYLRGYGKRNELWFRVVMTKEDGRRGERQTIEPVAKLSRQTYGVAGSWTVVGDEDIYWIGGYSYGDDRAIVRSQLHKHNIIKHSFDPSLWEPVSSPMDIPRSKPFLAAVGTKLYAVAGTEHYAWGDKHENPIWKRCGQVYDLHEKTWKYLMPHIKNFESYGADRAALVEKKMVRSQRKLCIIPWMWVPCCLLTLLVVSCAPF
ncbi:hypothetical protein A4A49_18560 [Nicotiana attenuata]|uniref:F-boxkelch-repeat protein n=1 Tax=Nicotiana attenuata TaxID=49451 RepID=A0A314KPN3_NICAT|nr:hypothetical protein A4A49_18560 [Nicotiana attenuata]